MCSSDLPGMPSPPVIGIACAVLRAQWGPWDQQAAVVAADYVRQVQQAGGMALVVPPQPFDPDQVLDHLDGLLLTGGNDLQASLYGAQPHAEAEAPDPERDAWEFALVRRAIAAGGAKTAEVPVKGGSHRGNFLASLYGDGTTLAGRENTVDWFKSLL